MTTESFRDLKRIWVYKKGKRVNCRIFYAFFRKSYVFGKKNSGFLKAAVLYFQNDCKYEKRSAAAGRRRVMGKMTTDCTYPLDL